LPSRVTAKVCSQPLYTCTCVCVCVLGMGLVGRGKRVSKLRCSWGGGLYCYSGSIYCYEYMHLYDVLPLQGRHDCGLSHLGLTDVIVLDGV
jgi:hypothetical protein